MDDLGAESIDLLDILFRIERGTGVKIEAADLGDHIQGGISRRRVQRRRTRSSPRRARSTSPRSCRRSTPTELRGHAQGRARSSTLFTVQNLADLVAQRARSAPAAELALGIGVDVVGVERIEQPASREHERARRRRCSPSASWTTARGSGAATSTSPPASPPRRRCSRRSAPASARGMRWTDVEVVNEPERPSARATSHGAVAALAAASAVCADVDVSLTHTAGIWRSPRRSRSGARRRSTCAST